MKKKNKFDELEEKLEPAEPIPFETTAPDGIDAEFVDEPPIIIGEPTFWDKAKLSLVRGGTFDFLRHFLIGFGLVGGAILGSTGNLAWSAGVGIAGGLVEGGRKVWSGKAASRNGGSKNRVLQKLLELVVTLLDLWMQRRRRRDADKV